MAKMVRKYMKFVKSVIILLVTLAVVLFYYGTLFAHGTNTKKSVRVGSAVNAFAFDLYKQIQSVKGNLFFSPYSISTALSMTYAGARGNTKVQMQDVLHTGSVDDFIHLGLADLDRLLSKAQGKKQFELHVANALWMEKQYSFFKDFLDVGEMHYDAALEQVDFKHASQQVVKVINQWVKLKTQGKIRDLIDPKYIDASTRLVLTNAIYFKGIWKYLFDPSDTKDLPFFLSDKETLNVPMMFQKTEFGYLDEKAFQVLELPYAGNDLSMLVLLPREISGLPKLESMLNVTFLSSCKSRLKKKEVLVFLPKFRFSTPFTLSRTLKEMGMTDAFTRRADFSGMDGTRNLFIGEVFHKAFVEVNERGTEASAGTAVVMKPGAAPSEPPPVFKADHPFVFLIRHESSGAILFMGRVVSPLTKSGKGGGL